jgi:hypothetical protein
MFQLYFFSSGYGYQSPESGLGPDPDPDSINPDPQYWLYGTGSGSSLFNDKTVRKNTKLVLVSQNIPVGIYIKR